MSNKEIDIAKAFLEAGELVAIPTETVYGLAANAFDNEAVSKIFVAKNRPTFDPLIVHTNSFERVKNFTHSIPEKAFLLAEKFMPGPLTLLLPKKDIIPDLVTSGLDTVAVRIPNHALTLQLLASLDFPLAAPSANPFGYISPTTAQHVAQQLGDKIAYILDGGACKVGIESTIIGFENNEAIVFRKGGLPIEAIEEVIGKVRLMEHSSSNPQAPGMLKSHYSPRKPFILTENQDFNKTINTAYLGFNKYCDNLPLENQLILSENGDFLEAARHLFAYMRALDGMPNIEVIYSELLPEISLGRAINDRLRRAATQE